MRPTAPWQAGDGQCANWRAESSADRYRSALLAHVWYPFGLQYDNCQHKWDNWALNIRGASFEGGDARPIPEPGGGAWGEKGEALPWYPLAAENASFAPRPSALKLQIQEVEAYQLMARAINASGREIVYAICPRIAGCDPSVYEFYGTFADTCMNQCPQHDVRDAWEGTGTYGLNDANSSISWHIDNYLEYESLLFVTHSSQVRASDKSPLQRALTGTKSSGPSDRASTTMRISC